MIRKTLVSLPCSVSLNYWFNLGSMLGITILIQIGSGVFLLMNYNALESYESIIFIMYEVNYGWFFKSLHRNNARFIFLCLYFHLYRNVMFHSYRLAGTWYSGMLIIVLVMGAGFSGYVLVGAQISL